MQDPRELLVADRVLRRDGDRYRTTRRWQGAMARAAVALVRSGEPSDDLRVPVARALVDLYGPECPDEVLATLVEVLTPIEAAELSPVTSARAR